MPHRQTWNTVGIGLLVMRIAGCGSSGGNGQPAAQMADARLAACIDAEQLYGHLTVTERPADRRVGPADRLICLDIQAEMVCAARARVAAAGVTAEFICGDAPPLPLRSASMDHVYLITVLGEIPDRAVALLEILRVLRPGGYLSVSEQFPDPDFVTPRTLCRERGRGGLCRAPHARPPRLHLDVVVPVQVRAVASPFAPHS